MDRCDRMAAKHYELADRYFVETRQFQVTAGSLLGFLTGLRNQKRSLSGVVISGHDGNGHFGGEFGFVNDSDIKKAFQNAAPVGDGVRSLLLWGCYTATPGSIEMRW